MANNDDDRFATAYKQGRLEGYRIIVDKETGVNYLFAFAGYAGGLTVLLDADGKPVVTDKDAREG